MLHFKTALTAEHIKKKGTGLYLTAVIFGLFMPLIYTIVMIVDYNEAKSSPDALPYNYFLNLTEQMLEGFTSFFFPLLIIISVSRVTQLDHKNGGWQLMETQPMHKRDIYFSKFTVILITNVIVILSLVMGCYLFGSILLLIHDAPQAASLSPAFGPVILLMLRLFLAGLFLSALQYLISVIIPSFIWSILIGFFVLLGYLFLETFDIKPDWYPIEFLGKIAEYEKGSELGYWITYSEIASVLLTIISLYIGFNWYRHKSIKQAFAGNGKRVLALLAVLVVFGSLTACILIPNTYESYTKTIVSGRVESDDTINKIYITDLFINDTVAVIPVINSNFHYQINKAIALDRYKFLLNNGLSGEIVMGSNDSTYLVVRKAGGAIEGKITGTRLAENQYSKKEGYTYSLVERYLNENMFIDNVDYFTETLSKEWNEAMNETDNFKTVDNYKPREDFMVNNKKLITIKFLNYWNDFLKKRTVMFTKQKTEESSAIAAMKKTVPMDDEGLLSNEDYFNYIKAQLTAANKEDVDDNTKSVRAIAQLKPGAFKDKMLYWQLKKSLEETKAKSGREALLVQYANTFTDNKYTSIINRQNTLIEKQGKGMPVPDFETVSTDGKPYHLADFKGRLLVIDTWATWCGPCRLQSPYFEKLAIKYKTSPIQFIAISIDDRKDKWLVEAKTKSPSVLQLHTSNKEKLGKDFNIESIPRFIFIDAQGNFINSKMPYPTQDAFENLLRESLGLPEEK